MQTVRIFTIRFVANLVLVPTKLLLFMVYSIPDSGSFVISGQFVDNIWPTLIFEVSCDGSELSIMQCPHTLSSQGSLCRGNRDSSVVCQGL